MRSKRLLCIVVAAMMIVMSSGCVTQGENGATKPSESERFETYLMDGFRETVGDNIFD